MTGDESWVFYDNTTHRAIWIRRGEEPPPQPKQDSIHASFCSAASGTLEGCSTLTRSRKATQSMLPYTLLNSRIWLNRSRRNAEKEQKSTSFMTMPDHTLANSPSPSWPSSNGKRCPNRSFPQTMPLLTSTCSGPSSRSLATKCSISLTNSKLHLPLSSIHSLCRSGRNGLMTCLIGGPVLCRVMVDILLTNCN